MTTYNNTTTDNPTHFPMAATLIVEARKEFKIYSENWCYPTEYKIGFPRDRYYAEVWTDGMDWTKNLWVVETCKFEFPIVLPMMVFDVENYGKFNKVDIREVIAALLCVRRDRVWLMKHDYERYNDIVWPYLKRGNSGEDKFGLEHMAYGHNSQKRAEFLVNPKFLPPSLDD
jgi:hypothetical protein